MNYEFSLNRMAALSLLVGSIVISVLLFGAGLLVGASWLTGPVERSEATAANKEPALPKEPVLHDEKEPAPKASLPQTNAPAQPATPTAPVPPKAPTATGAATEAAHAAAAVPSGTRGEVKIIEEALADSTNNENGTNGADYVTVQIGVFLDEREANRLLKDVERKGYAPTFFSGLDAEARQWYAVRIGAYSDKQQATNAAANFTRQEKMKAVVRPLGSL